MNDLAAIAYRKSRRSYLASAIAPEKLAVLHELAVTYNQETGLTIRIIANGSAAFDGFNKSYGLFSGVKTIIVLSGKKDDEHLKEKVGYYGELLVLAATKLQLGTCWVGGTFDRQNEVFAMQADEELVAVITVGNVAPESLKEIMLHKLIARKTKPLEALYTADQPVPAWFTCGVEAVQKAPSARNRQPVQFRYRQSEVCAFVEESDTFDLVDLGIAKAHFSLVAGGHFTLGNYGKFSKGVFGERE